MVQGENKSIRKVKLAKPCCWTTTFNKDDKVCGLVLLYQTGDFEISRKSMVLQGIVPGILGGIVKGFKGRKVNHTNDGTFTSKSYYSHLEGVFARNPFPDPSSTIPDNQEVVELNIDDIEIDEPVSLASTSTNTPERNRREKGGEREKLLDGTGAETKPRLRTPEEIMATYRKAGDASSAAGQARDKLLERQEKLERISKRTEELQSGAEDFASLANELVKVMENRKWWHI